MRTEKTNDIESYYVWIYIAGDADVIKHACREFCQAGLCVTVEPLDFIYTGGEESGARIGLINYPRFPSTPDDIWQKAHDLALFIRNKTFQDSVLIMDKGKTLWMSKRDK